MMLDFLLFNIGPTLIELTAACIIFFVKFGAGLVAATLAMMAIYIIFTETRDRMARRAPAAAQRRRQQGHRARRRFLLNYETVKYFNAEERETRRYDEAIAAFARATVRNEVSLAWLNIGQALITNLMMAGRDDLHRLGLEPGRFTPGDVVFVNTMLLQLFRPLDMLGWVYRTIRQGLIDMEAMWKLVDTHAEVTDRPPPSVQVGAATSASKTSISATTRGAKF